MDRLTFTARVAEYFKARPNTWIDGRELMQVGGVYASRTRISDARKQYGLRIVNRCRKVGAVTISEYRLDTEGKLF